MAGFESSSFDARDWGFSAPAPLAGATRVELPVPFRRDQLDVPCCVSIAVTTCMEVLDAAQSPSAKLAPLFNYYVTRDDPAALSDIQPRAALMTATTQGICRASVHTAPFTSEGALTAPTSAAIADALEHRILHTAATGPSQRSFWFERLTHGDRSGEWRAAIAGGLPVLFGFWLTPSYWSWRAANLAEVPMLALSEADQSEDGHCAVAVGFDADGFLVQDSRGTAFGSGGRWRLPDAALQSPLVAEAWVIRRINFD